jgi:hypothetical protein
MWFLNLYICQNLKGEKWMNDHIRVRAGAAEPGESIKESESI